MTAYATIEDLEDLALPAAALSTLTTAQKEKALEAASRKADGYFRKNWGVPIVNPNTELKEAVCSVAAWRLMRRRGFAPEAPDSNLRTAFEDAIKWFEACEKNECRPFDDADDATPSSGEGAPLIYSDCDPDDIWG